MTGPTVPSYEAASKILAEAERRAGPSVTADTVRSSNRSVVQKNKTFKQYIMLPYRRITMKDDTEDAEKQWPAQLSGTDRTKCAGRPALVVVGR